MSDPSFLDTLAATKTDAAAAAQLGALLDCEVPAEAAARARTDPLYAQALYTARKMPQIVNQMLRAPQTVRFPQAPGTDPATETLAISEADTAAADANDGFARETPDTPSAAKLAAKAAGSLLKWGMDGLKHAKPWAIDARLAACAACPHQAPAPDTLIYRGAKIVAGKDAKICTLCHCLTNTKAALATEHCPDRDPDNSDLSRWGEPYVPPEEQSDALWQR